MEYNYNNIDKEILKNKSLDVLDLTIKDLPFGKTISVEYRLALAKVICYIMYYNKDNKIATLPMITGGGKSTALINAIAYMATDDILFPYCGTIILKLEQKDCDEDAKKINSKIGRKLAYAYHSGKGDGNKRKNRISQKELAKYPILVMCHEGFKDLLKDRKYTRMLSWTDAKIGKGKTEYNEYLRRRLIIDEEISNIKIQTIKIETINIIENAIWNMGNRRLHDEFQNFITKVKEEFIKPYDIKRNKSEFIYLDINIPEELDEYIYDYADKNVQEAYIALVNFIDNGGYIQYSDDISQKCITTYGYIEINNPVFYTVQLDATAKTNYLYEINSDFEIIDLPDFKTYQNTYIHIFDKITGSRSKIQEGFDNGLLEECVKDIKSKASNGDKILIILNNKEYEDIVKDKFNKDDDDNERDYKIAFIHYGSLTGKNDWAEYNKLFSIGIPIYSETSYPLFYYLNSGEKDFNKYDTTMRPVSGARRYVEERFEKVRVSLIAKELIQGINRIRCRQYENGDTPEAHIYMINKDKGVDRLIEKAMPDVRMSYDWDLNYIDKSNNKNQNKRSFTSEEILISVLKRIQDDIVYRQELVDIGILTNEKWIKKKALKKISGISDSSWNRAIKTPLFEQFCIDRNMDIKNIRSGKHSIKL